MSSAEKKITQHAKRYIEIIRKGHSSGQKGSPRQWIDGLHQAK